MANKSILDDFLGKTCSICGKQKRSEHSFCPTCYYKLPVEMRQALYARFGNGYEEAFYDAKQFLSQNPDTKPADAPPKIKWPATSDELRKAGYEYDNDAKCSKCGERIEWWITPIGRKMPVTVKKEGNVLFKSGDVRESHFVTCPHASDFRKTRRKQNAN